MSEADHNAMMEAFEKMHGKSGEYKSKEEHEMWLGWLGGWLLAWEAARKYYTKDAPQ